MDNEVAVLDHTLTRTDANTGQFSIDPSNYYEFRNLVFQNGFSVHQQAGGHIQGNFVGCTVRNNYAQGIIGGGTDCQYTGNWIDNVGPTPPFTVGDLTHSLYLTTSGGVIRDNLITRNYSGSAMQLLSCTDTSVDSNVMLDCYYGIKFGESVSSGVTVDSNVMLYAGGMAAYLAVNDFSITNNYLEGGDAGIALESSDGIGPGDFTGGFTITDNAINTLGNASNVQDFKFSGLFSTGSLIDRNLYAGSTFQSIALNHQMQTSTYTTLATWQAAMNVISPGWEANSAQLSSYPTFVFADIAYLINNSTAEQIKQVARRYANGTLNATRRKQSPIPRG